MKVQVFINGKLAKEGRLRKGGTTLSLIGLPKGTFKVAFVASTASGENLRGHAHVPHVHPENQTQKTLSTRR